MWSLIILTVIEDGFVKESEIFWLNAPKLLVCV